MIIKRIYTLEEHALHHLLASSLEEGYRFIQRLVEEYMNGSNRFDKLGEALYVIDQDGLIIGVGGINIDPYLNDSTIGRLRHVYILPAFRGKGLAKQLIHVLMKEAKKQFTKVRLLTYNPVADKLYQSLGFIRVDGENKVSHILEFRLECD